MAFTNIAILGAGGNLGKHFMEALLASTEPKFNVTVLARPTSSYEAPSDKVKVIKHELTDQASVAESLRGIDAVLMMQGVNKDFVPISKAVIEAAITAGVKMVMPSDFGSKDAPIFTQVVSAKPTVTALVTEKAKEGKITYTIIKNGAFWDMPLKMAYGIDYEAKKATLFNEGTQKFNATSHASVARAMVNILRSPDEYANKTVYIHDFYTTQRAILDIVESEIGTKFETTSLNVEEVGRQSIEALARGERNPQNIFGAIRWSVWGKEASADWDENDDSKRLGLEKKDLQAEIKKKIAMGL